MTVTINPGKSGFSPSDRIQAELKELEKVAYNIEVGGKTVDNKKYTAILVKGMPLSANKFKQYRTDVLFLLPPEYPRIPPIGCYLNYPWDTVGEGDHHFTLQSYYGAPFLKEEGWYWYCLGLGGGFNLEAWTNSWKPGNRADNGHNLATLYVMAKHAINTD